VGGDRRKARDPPPAQRRMRNEGLGLIRKPDYELSTHGKTRKLSGERAKGRVQKGALPQRTVRPVFPNPPVLEVRLGWGGQSNEEYD